MPRGGKRPGAGRPRKPLHEKLQDGNLGNRKIKVLEYEEDMDRDVYAAPDWLSDKGQKMFDTVVAWLELTGCLNLINPRDIEEYAKCRSRWLECEDKNNQHGLLAKHPTTGQPIPSPYVRMGLDYLKQSDAAWNKIFAVIRDNCEKDYRKIDADDIELERLLSGE